MSNDKVTVSYSGLLMYDNCPSSFRRKYIDREEVHHDYEPSKAATRGTRIHNGIDAFLKDYEVALPSEVVKHQPLMDELKEASAHSEHRFAFNEDWEQCTFTSEDACIRGVIDAIHVDEDKLHVYEWKTGRKYDDHVDQRTLYGLAALLLFPHVENCHITTMYLDNDTQESTMLMRGMLDSYRWIWTRRVNKVQPPQPYPERPNWKCRFCPYSKEKGGLCQN